MSAGLTLTTPHDPRSCQPCNFANHRMVQSFRRNPAAERGHMATPCGGATATRWSDDV